MFRFKNLRLLIWVLLTSIFYRCETLDESQIKVDFTADAKSIYEASGVNFSLINPEAIDQCTWLFEGGEPEYFNEVNPPTIYYGKAGSYTVTLNVVSKGQKQVVTKENFILVQEKPKGHFTYVSIQAEKETITAGETIEVWIQVYGEDLQFEWFSTTGLIVGEGPKVEFSTGPCYEGIAEIGATVSNEYNSMTRTVKVNVVRPKGS
jgi:PKD repeat protein